MTSEENVTAAAKKNIPISDSSAIIAPLQEAVDLKIAIDSKKRKPRGMEETLSPS